MNSRPFRLTYNGRQVGGRFATSDAAKRAVVLRATELTRYPEPGRWAIEEVTRAPQTRALIRTIVAKPF